MLFPADYDAEFDAIFGVRPAPVGPTRRLRQRRRTTRRSARTAHEAWFVLVNAPRHGSSARAAGRLGRAGPARTRTPTACSTCWPAAALDVRDRMLFWREIRTPADLDRATRAPGGSIYGTSSNGARAAFLRPANRSPVPGLFLVGGSTHPGGGLPLVGLSAEIVADLVGPA